MCFRIGRIECNRPEGCSKCARMSRSRGLGAGLHRAIVSIPNPIVCLTVATAIAALAVGRPAFATEILRCARFDQGELPVPAPSPYPSAIARADRISYAIKSAPYSVVFFGDSLTEGWDTAVWEHSLAPRGVLNAGVSGDRTDNLLWRLEYGNLAGSHGRRHPRQSRSPATASPGGAHSASRTAAARSATRRAASDRGGAGQPADPRLCRRPARLLCRNWRCVGY